MPLRPDQTPTPNEVRHRVRNEAISYFQSCIDAQLLNNGDPSNLTVGTSVDIRFPEESFDQTFWEQLRQSYLAVGWKNLTYGPDPYTPRAVSWRRWKVTLEK